MYSIDRTSSSTNQHTVDDAGDKSVLTSDNSQANSSNRIGIFN